MISGPQRGYQETRSFIKRQTRVHPRNPCKGLMRVAGCQHSSWAFLLSPSSAVCPSPGPCCWSVVVRDRGGQARIISCQSS